MLGILWEVSPLQQTQTQSTNLTRFTRLVIPPGRTRVPHERLISFAFPERPGALHKFLIGLSGPVGSSDAFNVSLFHYRSVT